MIVLSLNAENRILYPIVCEKCQIICTWYILVAMILLITSSVPQWQLVKLHFTSKDPRDYPTYDIEGENSDNSESQLKVLKDIKP